MYLLRRKVQTIKKVKIVHRKVKAEYRNVKEMNTLISLLAYYLIAINVITFFVYGIDKYKAKHNKWRISEASLLLLAVIGGSVGAWAGMKTWHHKTMHKKFKYGVPAILLLQIALVMATLSKL